MKKDWHILLFAIIYIISFTLIYTIGFIGMDYFIWILLLFTVDNTVALLIILILLAFERIKNKYISEYIYLLISIIMISYMFYDFKTASQESGNYLHPIFKEELSILIPIAVVSHIIAYFGFNHIKKLIANKNDS